MKIGVFDSGYGGLTILPRLREYLPEKDYLYLGDNARAPYGTRSFDCIYEYTLQAVRYLQQAGCRLIVIACNTASAKALRTIQQHDIDPEKVRVLGVIRPTVEQVPSISRNGHIGVLATPGTVSSGSYVMELEKFASSMQAGALQVTQWACPMWVPLIESGEYLSDGADFFVEKYINEILAKDPLIDTLILGCTHYPLLLPKIRKCLGGRPVQLVAQGDIVAQSLRDYLRRHPEIDRDLSAGGTCAYWTTESADKFCASASFFLSSPIHAHHIEL